MDENGASWGARRDVIEHASFNLTQSIEDHLGGLRSSGAARNYRRASTNSASTCASRTPETVGASREAPHERGDHGIGRRAAPLGGIHAAALRGPGIGHEQERALNDTLSLRSLRIDDR
jgi:hypothetical protein